MFVVGILIHLINRIIHRFYGRYLGKGEIILFSFLSIALFMLKNGQELYFGLDKALMSIPFFGMGMVFVYFNEKKLFAFIKKRHLLLFTFVTGILMATFTLLNWYFADGANFLLYIDQYGIYSFAVPAAFFGVCMTMGLAKLWIACIKEKSIWNKSILFLSKNSLIIYPIHLLGVEFGKIICETAGFNHWTIMFATNMGMVMVALLLVPLVNRFLPFMTGIKRKKTSVVIAEGKEII